MNNRFDFFKEIKKDTRKSKLDQYNNIKLVKSCAKKAKLNLDGFHSNDELELYFDIYRDSINKQWRFPLRVVQ